MKIALVGLTRVGKDSVFEMIKSYLQTNGHGQTTRLAFGDDLKHRLYSAFPEASIIEGKPREWYETFGELGRQIETDMWVKAVNLKYKRSLTLGIDNFVITDVRQPNEAQWALDNGFILIKVYAPKELRQDRAKGDKSWQPVNPSERKIETIHCRYIIWNMLDLQNTKEQVEFLLDGLLKQTGN
jgi:hypothetical protein